MKRIFLYIVFAAAVLIAPDGKAQSLRLTLGDAVRLANDSSLNAFRYQNLYASGYWQWRTFKAQRLPGLSLSITPANYLRYIAQRYDSEENVDVFRSQRSYGASAGLTATQNVDFLGGSLYLQSDLEYLRNFGDMKGNQYSSVPVRIGYRQDLIGYNPFRWERKIEPLKYEKVKKEFLYNMETVSEDVVKLFFSLALAQTEMRLAKENLSSADTLYVIGERRFRIASISQSDLLTLRLDRVNAENSVENARIGVKRAMFELASYLGLDRETHIDAVLPGTPVAFDVPLSEALIHARANSPELMGERQTVLEAERDVNKAKVQSMFNATFNASVGFNQFGTTLGRAYSHPLRQDMVSVSIDIPLLDWGVRKGKLNMARNTLNVAKIASRQKELALEQDVTMTVNEFSSHQRLVGSAVEALDIADRAYAQTVKRFIIGKADLNTLTLSHNRQQDASRNYINSLQNYWLSYYKIRKLTLYDFERKTTLSRSFDNEEGVR